MATNMSYNMGNMPNDDFSNFTNAPGMTNASKLPTQTEFTFNPLGMRTTNTGKILIPTGSTPGSHLFKGSIAQNVFYVGGEKCNFIKWYTGCSFNNYYSTRQTFLSNKFTVDGVDGKPLTWCLALVPAGLSHSSDHFYLLPCFLPENDCKQVVVKIDLFVFDSNPNKQCNVNVSSGNVCSFDATDKSSSVYLLFDARKLSQPEPIQPGPKPGPGLHHHHQPGLPQPGLPQPSAVPVITTLIVGCNITLCYLPEADISNDLGNWFKNQDSDISLLSNDGKVCEAHKGMLAARSSVYAAMFSNMKETEQHEMKIEDMNGAVMEEMLRYVYTGKPDMEKLNNLAKDLLLAANKYNLKGLKYICESKFISELSVSNAVEMLEFAELQTATRLKSAAVNFIITKNTQVIGTEAWKNLEQSSFGLVKYILEEILTRQNNVKQNLLEL
ncbi:TD and POZ domain-containing protein 5-like [Planococcus citri]|uniref:TD and POZ domain-containing protein 5-like n=1 Tax=Planococcus citri TaxID=170843 RepID=UPI0031F858EC